ncbi:MAG: response regulator [bacterium]
MLYEILYVDDSDAMQKTVSMIFLNNPEFKITSLYDGSSLIAVLKKSIPSIIIINYNISNAISYNMIKEIKNNSLYSNIPVLLAAPSDLPNKERELFVEEGLSGFIYRPFDKETFINKIKRSLGLNINEDKIYDIAEFEKKSEDDNNQNIQSKKPEYLTENIGNDNNTSINTGWEQDSAELSEAFENLFKDDNIFKEFQNLNKENDKINNNTPNNFSENDEKLSESENISADNDNTAEIIGLSEVMQPEFESIKNIEAEINYEDREMSKNQQADFIDAPIEKEGHSEDSDDNDNDNDNEINEYISNIIINEDIGDSDNIRSLNFTNNNKEENTNAGDADTSDISLPESNLTNETEFNINIPEVYDITESNRYDDGSIVNFKDNTDNTNEKYNKRGEIKLEFLNDEIFGKMDEYLKKSIDDMINDIKPEIVENIKNILPEIAEKLIKEEIDKIKNENI